MSNSTNKHTIFADDGGGRRQLTLPWGQTIHMCWGNIRNRAGRFMLIFIGIAVVVAFFMSNLSYQGMVDDLKASAGTEAQSRLNQAAEAVRSDAKEYEAARAELEDAIHAQAVLERAGFYSDTISEKKQGDQQVWLMLLSGILCLVGITNTMLMSVTERIREIGTLKCLGALDGFVIRLFMIESVFIGLVGSLIGALVGYILTLLQVGMVLEFSLISFSQAIQTFFKGVPLAVVAGTVLTVMAAVYPTYVAARMKPVDAMRVEI
ncbi:MAG: FtsX-like permease family protein [bacterium]|nr:FtsX-like permease family protein [bacterium]